MPRVYGPGLCTTERRFPHPFRFDFSVYFSTDVLQRGSQRSNRNAELGLFFLPPGPLCPIKWGEAGSLSCPHLRHTQEAAPQDPLGCRPHLLAFYPNSSTDRLVWSRRPALGWPFLARPSSTWWPLSVPLRPTGPAGGQDTSEGHSLCCSLHSRTLVRTFLWKQV